MLHLSGAARQLLGAASFKFVAPHSPEFGRLGASILIASLLCHRSLTVPEYGPQAVAQSNQRLNKTQASETSSLVASSDSLPSSCRDSSPASPAGGAPDAILGQALFMRGLDRWWAETLWERVHISIIAAP